MGDTRIQIYRTYRIQGYRSTGVQDTEIQGGNMDTEKQDIQDTETQGGYTDTEIQDIQDTATQGDAGYIDT